MYKAYTQHEKKYGDKGGIEDVIVSKRKFQYEEVRWFCETVSLDLAAVFFEVKLGYFDLRKGVDTDICAWLVRAF